MKLSFLRSFPRRTTFRAAAAITTIALAAEVCAGPYPAQPIRLIAPFPPGSSNDIVGRIIAQGLTERLGRTVVVENRPGNHSITGIDSVVTSPPDGYNLVVLSTSFTTNALVRKLPFDPLKSFTWIALIGVSPNALVVPNTLPAKTVKELVGLAKARPGQLVYASTGVGSNAHLGSELFKQMTGTNLLHVPYKGGGPAVIATAGGQVHVCLSSLMQALPLIRASRLRALATTGEKRSLVLPEVPTATEAGVPGYVFTSWWGIAAPRGVAPAIVQRLNDEINALLAQPDVERRLIDEGTEPTIRKPADLGQHIASDIAKLARISKIAGIKPE